MATYKPDLDIMVIHMRMHSYDMYVYYALCYINNWDVLSMI